MVGNTSNTSNNFQITKINPGKYNIHFYLENNSINLEKMIDFHLIKLLYDLNPDIYEKIELKILNDRDAIILAINKHLFQDLGMTQKYSYVAIDKQIKGTMKLFHLQSINTTRNNENESMIHLIPTNAEQLPIEYCNIACDSIHQNKIEVTIDFKLDVDSIELPDFMENIVCSLFAKMFKRAKQFIENMQ